MEVKLINVETSIVDLPRFYPAKFTTYTVMIFEDEPISVTIGPFVFGVSIEGEKYKLFDHVDQALQEYDYSPEMQAMLKFSADLSKKRVEVMPAQSVDTASS